MDSEEVDVEVAARARLGQIVADTWRLEELIGIGGTGSVYRARDRNNAGVAIKVMHSQHLQDRKTTERFKREGMYANRVQHPAIPRVFDGGCLEDGCPYLVTELLSGQTLEQERLANGGSLPLEDALAVGFAALDVLMHAHRAGMIHRDLKPENLFRTTTGEIKLLDFGLGRFTGFARQPKAFTSVCVAMGTVGFMAPEQALGKHDAIGPTTDLWSLGATLLMLATGLETHSAETRMGALSLAATKPVVPTATRTVLIPADLCAVIDRALSFEQSSRFQSAMEMRQALEAVHDRLGASANTRIDSKPPVSIPPAARLPVAANDTADPRSAITIGSQTVPDNRNFGHPWERIAALIQRLRWEGIPKTRLAIASLALGSVGVGMLLADLLRR